VPVGLVILVGDDLGRALLIALEGADLDLVEKDPNHFLRNTVDLDGLSEDILRS
jgi:hypothetical protein